MQDLVILTFMIIAFSMMGYLAGSQVGYSMRMSAAGENKNYSYRLFAIRLVTLVLLAFLYGWLKRQLTSDLGFMMYLAPIGIVVCFFYFARKQYKNA